MSAMSRVAATTSSLRPSLPYLRTPETSGEERAEDDRNRREDDVGGEGAQLAHAHARPAGSLRRKAVMAAAAPPRAALAPAAGVVVAVGRRAEERDEVGAAWRRRLAIDGPPGWIGVVVTAVAACRLGGDRLWPRRRHCEFDGAKPQLLLAQRVHAEQRESRVVEH